MEVGENALLRSGKRRTFKFGLESIEGKVIITYDNCLLFWLLFIYGCVGKDRDKLVDLYSPQLDGTKETNLAPHLALCPLRVYTQCSRRHRQDITVKDIAR